MTRPGRVRAFELRVYRLLLRLAPRAFRDGYAREVEDVFLDQRCEPGYAGPRGALRFWADIAIDFVQALVRMRARPSNAASVAEADWRQTRRPLDMWRDDLVSAWRTMRFRPTLTAVAVLSLGLGLGGNALIFGLVDGLVLRPFPFPDPDRFVAVGVTFPRLDPEERFIEALSPAEYLDIRALPGLQLVSAFDLGNRNISGGDRPERVFTALVWGNPFASLGMPPLHGRAFVPEEMRRGGPPAAILSHRIWLSRFGGDPALVGRTIRVNGEDTPVVGIMPPGLLLAGTDLWTPLAADPLEWPRNRRQFTVIARLAPGASLAQVDAQLGALASRTARDHAAAMKEYADWRLAATPFHRAITREQRPAGLLLLAAAAVVLLVACVNLANVWLAGAAERQRDVAIRVALGASRATIARGVMLETFLVSLAGVLAGLALAWAGLHGARALIPETFRSLGFDVGLTGRVAGYALALAGLAGLAIGIAPATQTSLARLEATLREQGGSITGPKRSLVLRHALIVTEVALATMLLAAAGLVARSYARFQSMDPGFDRERVLTMRLTLPPQKYQGAAIGAFFDALVARVGALPGVESSAAASQFPPRVVFSTRVRVEGAPSTGEGALPTAGFTHVTPGFFDVLGIPLRVGRAIDARDRPGTPRVAVVNEAFVRRYLGGGTPIGRRVALAGDERDAPWFEVVGVAGDTRSRGPASPPSPEIFLPVGQLGDVWNQLFLLVRTAGDPRSILPAVREAVRHLDADQPVYAIQTLDDVFDAARLQPRVSSWLMGAFAALALVVAAVGLYGVLSYAVTARTREIGIRMALGADRSRVIGHVVGQAGVLLGIGAGMGVVGVLALGPLMTRLLQGLTPRDPVTIVLAIGVLLLTGIVATLVPARRASRVDPVVALRSD